MGIRENQMLYDLDAQMKDVKQVLGTLQETFPMSLRPDEFHKQISDTVAGMQQLCENLTGVVEALQQRVNNLEQSARDQSYRMDELQKQLRTKASLPGRKPRPKPKVTDDG